MGRRVAGRAFLEAYLDHGTFARLAAMVRGPRSAESLVAAWRGRSADRGGTRTLHLLDRSGFHRSFFPDSPAGVIHSPQPPEPELAWARQAAGPHAYSLTGVTHTLCSAEAVRLLRELVTAPFGPDDAIICTSSAVAAMIEEITGTYAEYLRSRLGGGLAQVPTARRTIIPLGVDVDRFRPPTPTERAEARRALGIGENETVLLFVGRLAHHAKAHPFPIFRAAAESAARSGKRVRLLLVGWAPHPAMHQAFVDGARELAPGVITHFIDGRDPAARQAAWHAADLFVSPSDSIQETFGLAVVEAMATGLPVIASDWDGYRDLVDDGSTGFLVPTSMVAGATVGATSRLLIGELSYDHFLAECSQATVVDVPAMAGVVARLVEDPALRRRMGEAGRARAVERFAWPRIVAAYEDLWRDLDASRRARALADRSPPRWQGAGGPSAYPSPERTFAAYPTQTLDSPDRIEPAPGAIDRVDRLLAMPLIHHAPGRRSHATLIRQAIADAPCSVADLDAMFAASGIEPGVARATVAWMLKYDLLRASSPARDSPAGDLDR